MKTDESVKEEFGISILRYNSIKTAMSKELKDNFVDKEKILYLPLKPSNYDVALQCQHLAAKVYKYLNGNTQLIHNKFIQWTQEEGHEFSCNLKEYADLHMDIYRITNVPKYRSFQYRLLQRGLVTNIQLHKWGLTSTDMCTYCNRHRETIQHLLCECENIQPMWESVRLFIKEKFAVDCIIT